MEHYRHQCRDRAQRHLQLQVDGEPDGGTANDRFQLRTAGAVSGVVAGGAGTNTLDYGSRGSTVTVNLANRSATSVFSGNPSGFNGITAVVGSTASDTLIGTNVANVWNLTAPVFPALNTGTINSTFSFSGVENLRGGGNTDRFAFNNGNSVSFLIDGGGGTDTLDYALYSGPVTVNLETRAATDVNFGNPAGFTSIEAVVGTANTSDTLIGPNTANTWSLTTNAGTLNTTFTFTGIENLTGGTNTDRFAFQNGGSIPGTINGAAGTDTLDYALYTSAVTVNLAVTAGPGGRANIESVIGGSGTDTLIGPNTANTWNLTMRNIGNLNNAVSYSAVENLTGGTSTDRFAFSGTGSLAGSVNGGGGTDTLDYAAAGAATIVNLELRSASGLLSGNAGGYTSIESVTGSGFIDTLVGTNAGATWGLTSLHSGTIGVGFTFTSFENLVGGTGHDALAGSTGVDSVWTITSRNQGNINGSLTFSSIETLSGHATRPDTFVFHDGAEVTGSIEGQAGTDTLDYSNYSTDVTVNLLTNSATGVGGTIGGIDNVTGGKANDYLVGNASDNTLEGGAGFDILQGNQGDDHLRGGNERDLLIGGTGIDKLEGGDDEDLVIGGTTQWDNQETPLRLILRDWSGPGTYQDRIDSLRLRGADGRYIVDTTTVFDDGVEDILTGGTGYLDWFFGNVSEILDLESQEQVN